MPRQSIENKSMRKLGRTGNVKSPSFYVTIPVDLIRSLGWKEGQQVVVKRSRSKIVIEDLDQAQASSES